MHAFAQQYFQQEVNYKIDVRLDANAKSISGNIETEYINNSPDTLDFIIYHLWCDAYKNNETDFAQQQLSMRQTDFYYSEADKKGYTDSLKFTVNDEPAFLFSFYGYSDAYILYLPESLHPGDTTIIKTPFYVKLPEATSRMGYDSSTFCLTQWYPKPAVYDKNGWNPMSYLDMGEFYSEFGTYEVSITLPDNYIVAATGNLITKKELERLEDYAKLCTASKYKQNIREYGSAEKEKTIKYTEKNIHDFAWFASTNFVVELENLSLPESGKNVRCWTFYQKEHADLWKNSIKFVSQSVAFFSEEIGEYPYHNCTAVDGPLGAGGGMEYPTITVVNASSESSLENVIQHEICHNWFYGILASNERLNPWIDEGFTSFYECKYNDKYYPGTGIVENLAEIKANPWGLNELPARYMRELGWLFLVRENLAQTSELRSEDMSMFNYFVMSYLKPVTVMYGVEQYLGPEIFKAKMNRFYHDNKFRHVYPEDISELISSESQPEVNKFYTSLMLDSDMPDYKIVGRRRDSILIKNKNGINVPLFINFGDSLVKDPGFEGKKKFHLPAHTDVAIDKNFYTADYNRNNNYYRAGFLKPDKPIKLRFANIIDNPLVYEIPYLPVIAYNTTDGWMPGLLLYSSPIPKPKFEYQIATLYGTKLKTLNGVTNLTYYIQPKKFIVREYEIYANASRFGINTDSAITRFKFSTGIKIKFRTDQREFYESALSIRHIAATNPYFYGISHFQQVQYLFSNASVLNPWSFNINAQRGKGFIKAWVEINKTITYSQKMKGLQIRVFVGKFLYNSATYYGNYNFRLSGNLGSQDYLYDNLFVGRAEDIRYEPESFWAHQFLRNDGGFTLFTPFGQTNDWLAALNLDSSTPLTFLDIYANIGYCPSITEGKIADAYYEAGIKLKVFKDFLCIYFPLTGTAKVWQTSNDIYTDNYFQKIRFTLSLEKINLLLYREKPYLLF